MMGFLHRTVRGEFYAEIGQINPVGDWVETLVQEGPFPDSFDAQIALKKMIERRKLDMGTSPKWATGVPYEETRIRFHEQEVDIDPLVKEVTDKFIQMTEASAEHWNLTSKRGKYTANQVNKRVKDYIGGLARKLRKEVQTGLEMKDNSQ